MTTRTPANSPTPTLRAACANSEVRALAFSRAGSRKRPMAAITAVLAAIGLFLLPARENASALTSELAHAARRVGVGLFAGVLVVIAILVYLRLHGSAMLERRLE